MPRVPPHPHLLLTKRTRKRGPLLRSIEVQPPTHQLHRELVQQALALADTTDAKQRVVELRVQCFLGQGTRKAGDRWYGNRALDGELVERADAKIEVLRFFVAPFMLPVNCFGNGLCAGLGEAAPGGKLAILFAPGFVGMHS